MYGTLKRGHANHAWLAGAAFGGEALVEGLRLYDLGPFPMAVEEPGFQIEGELFGVDAGTLAQLDRFEGAPRLYERILWPVTPKPGHGPGDGPPLPGLGLEQAWVYRGRAHQVRHSPALGTRYGLT